MAEPVAVTDRLILREWTVADEHAFYAVMNEPSVMEHLGGVQTPEQWHAAYERLQSYQAKDGFTFWIVERREDGAMMGFCGLKRCNSPGSGHLEGEIEIAWRLRSDAWGRGYAREAAVAAMDLAFDRFDAPFVIALTVPDNANSWGLMKRLGMKRRADLDFRGGFSAGAPIDLDVIVYRMDRAEWPAARAAAAA